jgi:hypothetical protein
MQVRGFAIVRYGNRRLAATPQACADEIRNRLMNTGRARLRRCS